MAYLCDERFPRFWQYLKIGGVQSPHGEVFGSHVEFFVLVHRLLLERLASRWQP